MKGSQVYIILSSPCLPYKQGGTPFPIPPIHSSLIHSFSILMEFPFQNKREDQRTEAHPLGLMVSNTYFIFKTQCTCDAVVDPVLFEDLEDPLWC